MHGDEDKRHDQSRTAEERRIEARGGEMDLKCKSQTTSRKSERRREGRNNEEELRQRRDDEDASPDEASVSHASNHASPSKYP